MSAHRETLLAHFADLFDNREDPVEHILAMSYEFDEQQLLNLLLQRPLSGRMDPAPQHLGQLADLAPVVIYDARKTRDSSVLPHFLDLLAVQARPWSCHHPKAYLIVTRTQVHLTVGSMNLTASGMFSNREVYVSFNWGENTRDDLSVLQAFRTLVDQEYADFESVSLGRILNTLDARLAAWSPAPAPSSFLLASGFGTPPVAGLDALLAMAEAEFDAGRIDRLYVVSPFFDRPAGADLQQRRPLLIDALESRLGSLRHKAIVTDEAGFFELSKKHLGRAGERQVQLCPRNPGADERRGISQANEGAAVGQLQIERALHAKMLVLGNRDKALVYAGSANFSQKAWGGANHELGVMWVHKAPTDRLWADIKAGLGCIEQDRFADLPDDIQASQETEDPEEFMGQQHYPEFVAGIALQRDGEGARFILRLKTGETNRLGNYRVSWGNLELTFDGLTSRQLSGDEVRVHLFSGRSLLFDKRSAVPAWNCYMPFNHDQAMFDARYEFVHLSTEDWMDYCLERQGRAGSSPIDEHLPGEAAPLPFIAPSVDRQANPLIRMQRYLSDFSRVEQTFEQRASDNAGHPERWRASVGQPLGVLAGLIRRSDDGPLAQGFQLGELLLLVRRLAGPVAEKTVLLDQLDELLPTASEPSTLTPYLAYCRTAT